MHWEPNLQKKGAEGFHFMRTAPRILLHPKLTLAILLATFVPVSSFAERFSQEDVKNRLGAALNDIPRTTVSIPIKEVKRVNAGGSAANQRFQAFQAGINGVVPEFNILEKTKQIEVPNYRKMAEITGAVGSAVGGSENFVALQPKLIDEKDSVASRFAGDGLKRGSLSSLIMDDSAPSEAGAAGHDINSPAPAPSLSDENTYKSFKAAAAEVTTAMQKQFADRAANPPEIEEARRQAEEKLEKDIAKAQQEKNRAEQAQAAANAGKAGGGNGGGGASGGGGGNGPESPKIADPGRGIASNFDVSKLSQPKSSGNEIGEAIKSAGASESNPGRTNSDPIINPVTMSNSVRGNDKTLGDTPLESARGLKLGGAKSTPQSLTFGGGAIPPTNQPGGSAAGNPALGTGGGPQSLTSSDPYAGNGVEKPYKAVNYNLSKDGGYGQGGGGGEAGAEAEGESTVDGGGEGLDAKTKELVQNVTRPGQFLPPAGDSESGYPGIFAYRGYLKKLCDNGAGQNGVAICRRQITYRPPVVKPVQEASFIASVKAE